MTDKKHLLAAKVKDAEFYRAKAVAERLGTTVSAMIRDMFAKLALPCDEQDPRQ